MVYLPSRLQGSSDGRAPCHFLDGVKRHQSNIYRLEANPKASTVSLPQRYQSAALQNITCGVPVPQMKHDWFSKERLVKKM
jgi:hypothetical protein